MHHLKKFRDNKLFSLELESLLNIGIIALNVSREKKETKNRKSYSLNKTENKSKNFDIEEKRIDALIAEYEKEKKLNDSYSIKNQQELKDYSNKIVETRNNFNKKPEIPYLETDLKSVNISDKDNVFKPIEKKIDFEKQNLSNDIRKDKENSLIDIKSRKKNKLIKKSDFKLPRIKIRRKNEVEKIKSENTNKKKKMKFKKFIKDKKLKDKKTLNNYSQETSNIKTKEQNEIKSSILGVYNNKNTVSEDKTSINNEIQKILEITDNLLGQLPEEVIDEFVKSKDFELYKEIIKKYKIM